MLKGRKKILHSSPRRAEDPPATPNPHIARSFVPGLWSRSKSLATQRNNTNVQNDSSRWRRNGELPSKVIIIQLSITIFSSALGILERQHPRRTPLHNLRIHPIFHIPLLLSDPLPSLPPYIRRIIHIRRSRRRRRHNAHLPFRSPPHAFRRPGARQSLRESAKQYSHHCPWWGLLRVLPRFGRGCWTSRTVHGTPFLFLWNAAPPSLTSISPIWIWRCLGWHYGRPDSQDGRIPAGPDQEAAAGARSHTSTLCGRHDTCVRKERVENRKIDCEGRGVEGAI